MNGGASDPTIVVVGAASRDLADDDPRGWRLGGGVSYSALLTARLGIPTAAVIGVDEPAASAHELDTLRAAGVQVQPVPLAHAPVFRNVERPEGRLQQVIERSDRIPTDAVPSHWRRAAGWMLTPVAAELDDAWAAVPREDATVVVGWQGLLRVLVAGQDVRRLDPAPHALLGRADIVGVSGDDFDPAVSLDRAVQLLRPGATLVVTQGDRGGLVLEAGAAGPHRMRRYPAVRSHGPVDATGAGDVFLAALGAARIDPRLVGGRLHLGLDLLVAAAAAALVLEAPGLEGVPDRARLRARVAEARVAETRAANGRSLGYGGDGAADPVAGRSEA